MKQYDSWFQDYTGLSMSNRYVAPPPPTPAQGMLPLPWKAPHFPNINDAQGWWIRQPAAHRTKALKALAEFAVECLKMRMPKGVTSVYTNKEIPIDKIVSTVFLRDGDALGTFDRIAGTNFVYGVCAIDGDVSYASASGRHSIISQFLSSEDQEALLRLIEPGNRMTANYPRAMLGLCNHHRSLTCAECGGKFSPFSLTPGAVKAWTWARCQTCSDKSLATLTPHRPSWAQLRGVWRDKRNA